MYTREEIFLFKMSQINFISSGKDTQSFKDKKMEFKKGHFFSKHEHF